MKDIIYDNYFSELTDNERNSINKIVSEYDLKMKACIKIKSSYKIDTNNGTICLKRIRHGRLSVKNGSILADELVKNSFNYTTKYIRTKDGELFVKYKKTYFYATEWINGEECDLNDIDEAIKCSKLLAEFHIVSSKIDTRKFKIKNNLKNLPQVFNANLSEIEKNKRIIEKKKVRNEFDIAYENVVDDFHYRGMLALNLLNNSDYYKLSKEANRKMTICNDSFYNHNIIKKDEFYYIIDLNNIMIDLQINELAKYIRRIMFKKSYKWDFSKAKEIIEAYNSVRKLTKNEVEVMLALIIFPYRFWKLGNRRYVKHKKWNEIKYMNKLNRLIKYNEYQQRFLDEYLNFLQSYE